MSGSLPLLHDRRFHKLVLQAPAKINLHLRVAPPGEDGFHPLLSWFCAVSLFDTLEFSAAGREGPPLIELRCDDPALPCDQTNLIARAGMALAAAAPAAHPLRIALQKRIPTGAGLGGGSSDGASALMALNYLWNAQFSTERLSELAAKLGSDLPFFLHGPSSICRGRGEIVQPTSPPQRARWALLILPRLHMPTPAVYRRFDQLLASSELHVSPLDPAPDFAPWAQLPSEELLQHLVNDLEAAAFSISPELAALRAALERLLHRPVRMSGSGSCLFTLFDSHDQAQAAWRRTFPAGAANAKQNHLREFQSLPRFSGIVVEVSPNMNPDLNASWRPA